MSAKATFWAWRQPVKPATAKLVLLCLADCHNGDNGCCNPSIPYICRSTGLDRKTVIRATEKLSELGLMTLEKSHGSSTRYRLQTSTDIGTTSREDKSAELDEKPVPKTALVPKTVPVPKTDKSSTENGTGVVPKTVPEPTKNLNNLKDKRYRSLDLPDGDDEYLDQVREFIDHRCNLKKPVTQNALGRFLKLVEKTSQEIGLTDREIIAEVIDAGWQSFQPHWLQNRLEKPNGSKPNQQGITRNPSAVERVKARRRAAEQAMGTVGPDDRDVRAQVDIEHGRGAYRHMGKGTS